MRNYLPRMLISLLCTQAKWIAFQNVDMNSSINFLYQNLKIGIYKYFDILKSVNIILLYIVDFAKNIQDKNHEGCWKCLKTPSTTEWIPCSVSMSIYVFLLLFFRSPRNAKNVEREWTRKRDRWDTLSVFTIEPLRLPGDYCVSSREFFSRASRVSLDFFSLMRLSSFYTAFWFPSFWLVFISSGRSRSTRSTAQMRRVQLRNSHLLGYTAILPRKNENNATLIQVIDQGLASPRGNSHG